MTPVVSINDVSFEFPNGRKLFSGLNLTLDNCVTALVGPNGVGKTTLAALIADELQPTHGNIIRYGSVGVFKQQEDPPPISVDEFLEFDYDWSLLRQSLLSSIERTALCTTLSGGEWIRIRLARQLRDHYLILDEPTNNLDRQGRAAVMELLRQHSGGVLLISHDRECLSQCQNILELSNKGLSKFGGSWQDYLDFRDQERARLGSHLTLAKRERDKTFEKRQELIERQDKRSRQAAKDAKGGGLPRILVGARKRRAQVTTAKVDTSTLEKANAAVIEAFEAFSDLKVDPLMYADILGAPNPAQKLIAAGEDFNVCFAKWLYPENLNFHWKGNVRLAIKGANGSGKSTLLKAILGAPYESRGKLTLGNLNAVYIDQNCELLDRNQSVLANIHADNFLDETEIRNGLAKFLFTNEKVFQKVHELSGGERLRAAFAKVFLKPTKPELLILDEPTNNLDLRNIEFMENFIKRFPGALIVISHDEVFLKNSDINEELRL